MSHAILGRLSLLLLLFAGATPQLASAWTTADGAAEFEEQSAAAQALVMKGKWEAAQAAWLETLRAHAGADYVRSSLPEIRVALKRAAFWAECKRPDPRDLVSGKLTKYSRTSGKIRITYNTDQLEDFEGIANYKLHPLHFRGTYTVVIEAMASKLGGQQFFILTGNGEGYTIVPGYRKEGEFLYYMHSLSRMGKPKSITLEEIEPELHKTSGKKGKQRKEKSIKLEITVSEKQLKVRYAGKSLFSVKRKDEPLGQFGFLPPLNVEKITIDGKVEIAWIDQLIDASVQEEWRAFEKLYTEPRELSAWSGPVATERTSLDLTELSSEIPNSDKLKPGQVEYVEKLVNLINKGKHEQVATLLEGLTPRELPPATREFMSMMNWLRGERFGRALQHAEVLCRENEVPFKQRLLTALLYARVERRAEAIVEFEALIAADHKDAALYVQLAEWFLLEGSIDAARERIDTGLTLAPGDSELLALRTQVAKADSGPSWKKVYLEEGERLDLSTNIDPRITRILAREANEALVRFCERYGELAPQTGKLKAFVFSGSSSYSAYIDGVSHDSPENTAGVFSPRLKQILIWNQPDRAQLLEVLRHEVMHAYLDTALGDTPMWLGEGLAEYSAAAKQDGNWKEGAAHKDSVAWLERMGLEKIRVKQLLYLDQPTFMVNAQYCYPMSWAFVDFLLHSSAENAAIFDALWSALQEDIASQAAVHRVFDGLNLEQLDEDFWAHVRAHIAAQ